MTPEVISALAAITTFAAVALIYLGYQASRAKAATPEMEDRLERFGSMVESTTEEERTSSTPVADQLERAVALGDDRRDRFFHLAALHQRSGDHKAAEEYYLRGKEIAPDHPLRGDVEQLLDQAPERPNRRKRTRFSFAGSCA